MIERMSELTERELLEQILQKVTNMETRMNSVETKIGSMNTKIGSMETKMDSMELKMDSMESKIGSMETRMNSVEEKIDGITRQVVNNSEQLFELKNGQQHIQQAVRETEETVARIELTQKHQERTIDLLSRRSIDQEAELRRLH
jgi:chromosome segregation ATPase